jgi:protochlorophyllide reductase
MVRFLSLAVAVSSAAVLVGAFTPTINKAIKAVTKPVIRSPFLNENTVPTSTVMNAMLTQTELPEKLYFKEAKEMPKVLGGLKIGLRKLVVITGASSGLGLNCAATLSKTGDYFVVMACRDVEKGKKGE